MGKQQQISIQSAYYLQFIILMKPLSLKLSSSCLIKVLLLIALVGVTLSIKGLGLNPIKPFHLNKGKETKYLFNIVPQIQILTNAKIKVTFPLEFQQSDVASDLQCMIRSQSTSWRSVSCVYSKDSVVVDAQTIKNQNLYALIASPTNPQIYDKSSNFKICLMYDQSIADCNSQFGKVVFPDAPRQTAATATNPNVTSLTSSIVGKASTYQFKFTLSTTYQPGNTLRVTFPPGFTTSVNPICQMSGTYNQVIKTFVWPDKRSIQCQQINKTISSNQVLKIIGIYNPHYQGTFGLSPNNFKIELLFQSTTIVLEEISLMMTTNINAGVLSGKLYQENNFIRAKAKYFFTISLQNPLSSQDFIQLKFDDSWILYQDECAVITGIVLAEGQTLSCKNRTLSGYTYLNISNFQSASVSSQLVFYTFVGSPNSPTTYPVEVSTGNSDGVMDKFTLNAVLNSTSGTLDMLSINAITANAKVPVGQTGPLEITLFLNTLLPQTNVLTQGKFQLKIYPKIPLPDTNVNGVIKCYFFNNIPASTCTWDVSNSLYTLVTIKTPQNNNFQYSQIPITITTEGATNKANIGITIDSKVTRYRFELNAFKQDSAIIPTEVFYSQYIADAIDLSLTTYVLTKEINQYTHLRFDWVTPYSFTTPLSDNLRIKIEFLGRGGWAANLGYEANKIYKRFPCMFSENRFTSPRSSNPLIACDLYTYTSGPHASLTPTTSTTSNGPYILVYGFRNGLPLGNNVRLQIGKLLIGTSINSQTKIRFSIIQETPDMLTKYIELYYTEFTAFTTVNQNFPNPTGTITPTISNSQIQTSATHTYSMTTISNGFAIIYQYDMTSTSSFTNGFFNCTNGVNECVSLGYPANWIIEWHQSNSFPTSVTSSFTRTNGMYAGTFSTIGRVFNSNSLTIFKGTANRVYTFIAMYGSETTFIATEPIYKMEDIYYTIEFRARAAHQSNGFIRFVFGGGVQVSAVPFCTSSTLPLHDASLGLQCISQNSKSTLKIYNVGALTLNTYYTVRVRLTSTLATTDSILPTVTTRTYHTINVDTSLVTQFANQPLNNGTVSNYFSLPNEFKIQMPRITLQTPRLNYVGKFQIQFRPTSDVLVARTIKVELPNHAWNTGKWTVPTDNTNDPLVCLINNVRVPCTYTINPLIVTMSIDPAGLNSGIDNYITLDTEYVIPENGIKYPTKAGQYVCYLSFLDATSPSPVVIESTSFYVEVKARKFRNLDVQSYVNDISQQNLFRFEFQVDPSSYPNSYFDTTTYSRIFLQFPTVDSLGNALFDADLKGYTKTGEYVGCHFYTYTYDNNYVNRHSSTNDLRCRLIKSQVLGQPAIVQVINHRNFDSTAKRMRVYVARVFNPAVAVTSVPIGVKIVHVTVANNNEQVLYEEIFDLFMNTKTASPYPDSSSTCYSDTFESGDVNDATRWMLMQPRLMGVGSLSSNGFQYVMKLPRDFIPRSFEDADTTIDSSLRYCPFTECMTFPDIGYIIYHANSNNSNANISVTMPSAISQRDVNLANLVWQDGRLLGTNNYNLNAGCWRQMRGDIYSVSFDRPTSGNDDRMQRRRQEVTVQFTTDNDIPAGGSIEIVWPSSVLKAYPHCKSLTSAGSSLFAQGGSQNGQIGCAVQATRNWVITSFQALTANSVVIIMGQIDHPTSSGNMGFGEILTYNNTHATDIRYNGFVIDYYSSNSFGYSISTDVSWNIDTQITTQETLPLRINHIGDFQFKFKLASNFQGPNIGKIQLRLSKKSILQENGGFTVNINDKHVCQFTDLSSYQKIGCIILTLTDDTTVGNENIYFQIISSSQLASTSTYSLKVTTLRGTQPEGLNFPTVPGSYRVSLNFDVDGTGSFAIHDHLYIQVFGTQFKTLDVTSFVTLPSETNLIWFSLAPQTTIQTTDQLVIEIPTKSAAGQNLFSNTLGLAYADGDYFTIDILSGTFTPGFMQCRIYHGDQTNHKPVKIICGKFTQSFENTETILFAIEVINPSISLTNQISIPFIVYTMDLGKQYRTNYNLVENAVYLRSGVSPENDIRNIYSSTQRMQRSGSILYMQIQNLATVSVGEYFIVQFQFPLRVNGIVADACRHSNGNVYGDAYYHQYLWFVVCVFDTNAMGTQSQSDGTINMMLYSFYTPWYYLTNADRAVTVYAYHYNSKYTSKGNSSILYPNQQPRRTPDTPVFTMTPIHSSTKYRGSRDDYRFLIQFATTDTSTDLSYTKLIAIIFPSNFYLTLNGQDCVEDPTSEVQVQECWIDTGSRVIWIRPVIKSTYTNNKRIAIVTRDLAIQNPTIVNSFELNQTVVKFYSWENITQPSLAPMTDNNYAYMIIDNLATNTFSFSNNPSSFAEPSFSYINYPHQRYYQETPYSSFSHRAPFEMEFIPHLNFGTLTGAAYHEIKVTYPSTFTDTAEFLIRDLKVFRPICYLANNRINRCTIDIANNNILMNFQFSLTADFRYHLYFSIRDPRNADFNGFLATSAVSNIRLQYKINGSATIYYTESDTFPSLINIPSGRVGPFRAFTDATVEYGNTLINQQNSINFKLTFNRTDITGLVFEFNTLDNADAQMYSTSTAYDNAFYNVKDGEPYPCGNNGLNAGGNVKCFLFRGDYLHTGTPTKIVMTDFTYVSQMNCRFIFINSDAINRWLTVKVKAYGGVKSATNLYGDKYMGQWQFTDIFISQSGSPSTATYISTSYRLPSQSPWRNTTMHYVFSRNNVIVSGRMSMAVFNLYQSNWAYAEDNVCFAELGSTDAYDDLLILDQTTGGVTYRKAYFITTWNGNKDASYGTGSGWQIKYLKCRFYAEDYYGYFFYSDTDVQIATQRYNKAHMTGLTTIFSAPVSKYFAATNHRNSQSSVYIGQIDLTPTLNSVNNFQFQNGDAMTLVVYISGTAWWGTISTCDATGGFIPANVNTRVTCTVASSTTIVFKNVGGFQVSPILATTTNVRIKFKFTSTIVGSDYHTGNIATNYIYTTLYANDDAYTNNQLPIFQEYANLAQSCYYVDPDSCYYNHNSHAGTAQLLQLSDTFMRVSFKQTGNPDFGTDARYGYYFDITYRGFNFGSTCTISNVILEISLSTTPGLGTNNTINADYVTCDINRFRIYWNSQTNNSYFRQLFGNTGLAADNIIATAQYMNLYITVAPSANQDLPVLHHQQVFIDGTFSWALKGVTNYNYMVRANGQFLPSQSLSNTATLATMTTNRGGVTELYLQLTNLQTVVGSAPNGKNYLLLIEFISSSGWTGTNDPFDSYINNALNDELVACKCTSGIGPLSIATTTPFTDATCRRRKPITAFNAYAILIDFYANKGDDVRCYFPEFKIQSGVNVQAEVKVVYKDSYPPDLTGGRVYGSIFRNTTNTLTFSGSSPSMSLSGFNSITESPDFYAATTAVGSSFSGTYTLSGSWSTSYNNIYINYRKAGPVPAFSFCADGSFFSECRVYTGLLNLIVAKLKVATTSFSMSRGSSTIQYPTSQWNASAQFGAIIYVGDNTQWQRSTTITRTQNKLAPISSATFSVRPDIYGSGRANFETTLLFSMNILGKTLYSYIDTGSKLTITYSSLTQNSKCQVWVQNEPEVQLTCVVATGQITVYSRLADYATSNNIWVSLGITNPNAASWGFTLKLYDYFYSAGRNSLVISTSATYPIDNTFSSNTKIPKSRLLMYPFRSRYTITANSPLRIRFKMNGNSVSYGTPGKFTIINSKIAFSSKFLCHFYEYSSFKNMIQKTERNAHQAICTGSSTTLTVLPPKSRTISNSNFYELVIVPVGITLAQCTAVGCQSQSGFHQTNFDTINFVAYPDYNAVTVQNQQVNAMYLHQGNSMISLEHIYLLCSEPTETSLYIQFQLNFNSVNSYPSHYIEIIFWDLTAAAFSPKVLNDIIPCQLSTAFTKISNRDAPNCRLASADTLNGFIKIRIQNFGPITIGSHWIALDDFTLPTPTSSDSTNKFDISIGYYGPSNLKYEKYFPEIFIIDGTNSTNPSTISVSFSAPSTTQYGASTSGSMSFTWPFDTSSVSASDYSSKISFNINGGYAATWANIDTLTFEDAAGTYQLLWVNKKLNKFIFKMAAKSTIATVVSITNLNNPYPFQKAIYNVNNNIEMNVYQNFFHSRYQTFNQPLFTVFTKAPSIVHINQNLPTNTFDIYPSTNKFSPGALVKLILSLAFDQTTPNIVNQNLDIMNIEFTSGLSYIEQCKAFRNNSQYGYELGTCQTYKSGSNWNIVLYGITQSQLDVDWQIQVFARFTSATLGYTSRLKSSNGQVHFESIYSNTMSDYLGSRSIPTTINWMNQKYFKYYFENQQKFLQAQAGVTTPYLRFRISFPQTYDGYNDDMRIWLPSDSSTQAFSTKNSNDNMICTFLPATQTNGERDFSVGKYARCLKDTSTSPDSYLMYVHGGLTRGQDYLIQIQEKNIVTTEFYMPTSPSKTELIIDVYSNDLGYWNSNDQYFRIPSYRNFRSVEILHTTTTVSDYDTLTIKYKPYGNYAVGDTTRQLILRLSVSGLYHQYDGGLEAIYAADGIDVNTINSGFRFSEVVGNPTGFQVTTVKYSQYSNSFAPLVFSLSKQAAYTDNVQYTWRIPLLKNPSVAYSALRYNLSLIQVTNTEPYFFIVNHHESINEYYTVADTSVVFTTSLINTNRFVQTVNGIDLSVSLSNTVSVDDGDVVVFKLDRSKIGLISDFLNGNDTSNYNYYYFHTIHMVMAQKKTSTTINTVGIGQLSDSINYKRTFGLSWVKIHDTSASRQSTNPKTLRTSVPPLLTLNELTSYTAATLTHVQGLQTEGSSNMYRLQVTVPIVPEGGYIKIKIDSTKISPTVKAHCRVGTNITRSLSDVQALRCFRVSDGFVATGFSLITANKDIQLFFHIDSKVELTAQAITIETYGLFYDSTSLISTASPVSVTHVNDSFPTTLKHVQKTVSEYYASVYNNYYYEFEGSLNPRFLTVDNGFFIVFRDQFVQYGYTRFWIKKNDSSVPGWTELKRTSGATDQYGFFQMPPFATNDLDIYVNQQYIWRCKTTYASYWGTYNGFRTPFPGDHNVQIWLQYSNSSSYQHSHQKMIFQPVRQLLTVQNRYPGAGRKTMLKLTLPINMDLNAGTTFNFYFDTNNLLYDMFPNDVEGQTIAVGQTYKEVDCREQSSWVYFNPRCTFYFGDSQSDPPKPARLKVVTTNYFNGYPSPTSRVIQIANILNPSTVGMKVGVRMVVPIACENNENKQCPYIEAQGHYTTTSGSQNLQTSDTSFTTSNTQLLATSVTHTFGLILTSSLTTNDIIYIVYPQNFQGRMPSNCSASGYSCQCFPERRWITLDPTGIVSAGSITIVLTGMWNPYYAQAESLYFKVTVARGSGSSLADTYNILQTPFTTIKSSSMTIAATQTPNIYLRNYANTAIFTLNSLFSDARIRAIYLKLSTDATSWQSSYCNATVTSTGTNTYPNRFICNVYAADPTFLQITMDDLDFSSASVFNGYAIRVHAKFTLSDFSANQPILYQTASNISQYFYAYGSVSTTSADSKFYQTECFQTVPISQHLVPIISDITFNKQSFAYRVAKVNSKQIFYLLLKPSVAAAVTQMVFQIPLQFDYPGVFDHDYCYVLGRTKTVQQKCVQSREKGMTLVKLVPTSYDNGVRIIQLGSISQQNWFTSPSLPGDFYNMTVQLYGAGSVLLEKQTIDISPIYGQSFDIPSITIKNIRNPSISQSVYDITFVTGTLQIPPGAKTTSTTLTSEIQFIFQSYNAADATNVFSYDLGTKLSQGDQVGCVIQSGIVALAGKRLKCILHIGTNSTDKPIIKVINHDFINPGTSISISFAGIQSLQAAKVNTISIGVKLFYNSINAETYLYIPTPKLPTTTLSSFTVDYGSTWRNSMSINTNLQDPNIVLTPASFFLYAYNWYGGSSTGAQDQFILLKFTPKTVIDPNNIVNVVCENCSSVQIFYATGIVRFRHNYNFNSARNFSFQNFPTSAFSLESQIIKVEVQIYDDYQQIYANNFTLPSRTVEKCTLFNFGVVRVSSLNGGQIGVTYVFSLKTNHFIPENGAISITIPSSYGNMVVNKVTCKLSGFQGNVYCSINTPSRIDIYANGTQISKDLTYQITVAGLQNPNQDSSGLIFYATSYFDDNIYDKRIICQNQVIPPTINVKAVRTCTLQWTPSYHNKGFNASYLFLISCGDLFRGDSILYIQLPSSYSARNPVGERYCKSFESTTLVEQKCELRQINGSLMLVTNLRATTQTSLSLITNLFNPTNNSYVAKAFVTSRGVIYASTENKMITILSNSYVSASSSSAELMNSPKEAGILATYIFKLAPISTFIPDNIAIKFPDNFYVGTTDLTIGLVLTQFERLFSRLTYDNVQKILSNSSNIAGTVLKAYPSFIVSSQSQNTIEIKNVSAHLSSTEWTYIFIRGINNPSIFRNQNFTITYYKQTTSSKLLDWFYEYPLTYYISNPPNFLSLDSVTVSDHDLLYPSEYTFVFSGPISMMITTPGKKLSIVVVIPAFYKSTLDANSPPVCKFAQLTTNSTCQRFASEIVITETFAAAFSTLTLKISYLLNPQLETYCNTTDVNVLQHTNFKLRIMDVQANTFLFETSSVVDASNCQEFYTERIPISIQYPLIMTAGLSYNITFGLTKPTQSLQIKTSVNQTGFTFSPETVKFNSLLVDRLTTTIYLRSDVPAGNYTINFQKTEIQELYRNMLPLQFTVIAAQAATSRPTIKISQKTQSTIGYPVKIPIEFSLPSSTPMTLFINITEESGKTLAQYSPHFSNFTLQQRIIRVQAQKLDYYFTVQQHLAVVPPMLTLNFKITSLYPIVHDLETPTMYLCFSRDPKHNVLRPPLQVSIRRSPSSCSSADVGKPITNIFVSNQSKDSSAGGLTPNITKIVLTSVSSTSAVIKVFAQEQGQIFYINTDAGDGSITESSAVITPVNMTAYSKDHRQAGSANTTAQTIYDSALSQLNHFVSFSITGLSSSRNYIFYAVSRSNLGVSTIQTLQFKTTDLSLGVMMKMTFLDIVSNLDIVKALQKIIRISPFRIKVLTSTFELQQIKNNINQFKNNPKYLYEVVIAPDPTNDITSPMSIASSFTSNSTDLAAFKKSMPNWDNTTKITFHQLRPIYPRIRQMPTPKRINLYNATFEIKLWEKSSVYAILIEDQNTSEDTLAIAQRSIVAKRNKQLTAAERKNCPKSKQIKEGLDFQNNALGEFKKFSSTTDKQGYGIIFFDDLKPGSKYKLYLTCSSILPYETTFYWKDQDVIIIEFETLHNPNLMGSKNHLEEFKQFKPELAAAILRQMNSYNKKNKVASIRTNL